MKALGLGLLVLLSIAQPACDRGTTDPTKSTGTAAAGPITGAGSPTVKLLDAGKAPKKALRFTARQGLKKNLTMTMDMAMTINVGGSPRVQKIPTIKMPLDIVITEVAKNGDLRYTFKLLEPEIVTDDSSVPAVVDAMKGMLVSMTGLSGDALVTNRGVTKSVDIKVPAGANPQIAQFIDSLKQSIGQMCAPLPEQEVGVGAKWETTTKVEQNGLTLVQVATTELVSVEGDVLTLNIVMKQTAAPQTIKKNGVTVEMQKYTGTGGGDSTINLAEVVPSKATVTMKSEMEMKSGGQQIGMGIDLFVTIGSK